MIDVKHLTQESGTALTATLITVTTAGAIKVHTKQASSDETVYLMRRPMWLLSVDYERSCNLHNHSTRSNSLMRETSPPSGLVGRHLRQAATPTLMDIRRRSRCDWQTEPRGLRSICYFDGQHPASGRQHRSIPSACVFHRRYECWEIHNHQDARQSRLGRWCCSKSVPNTGSWLYCKRKGDISHIAWIKLMA